MRENEGCKCELFGELVVGSRGFKVSQALCASVHFTPLRPPSAGEK